MGIPIPKRKPQRAALNNSEDSILGSIFNTAKNVFKNLGNIELERYEMKRLAKLRAEEQAAKIRRDETLAGTAKRYISYADDPKTKNITFMVGAGMIGVAVILLIKGS